MTDQQVRFVIAYLPLKNRCFDEARIKIVHLLRGTIFLVLGGSVSLAFCHITDQGRNCQEMHSFSFPDSRIIVSSQDQESFQSHARWMILDLEGIARGCVYTVAKISLLSILQYDPDF